MRKSLLIALAFLIVASPAYPWGWGSGGSGTGIQTDTNCNQAQYYPIGTLCQDTDDAKLYKGNGTGVTEITAGTGMAADGSVPWTGAPVPNAANTIAIGSATAEWADLYLGDGAIIYGQNDQSNTITSSASGWIFKNPLYTGVSGASYGGVYFYNPTSGSILLSTVAGALGTRTINLPAESGTVCTTGSVCTGYASSGAQTFNGNMLLYDGAGDSPALTLQDGTSETAAFVKNDGGFLGLTTAADRGLNILTGNLKVGNGTPGATLDGEDLYVEGTGEFDGLLRADASLAVRTDSTTGGSIYLYEGSNNGSNYTIIKGLDAQTGDNTVLVGKTFTDTKWCSYSTTAGLTCNQDTPAGSGDITAVGSCLTGDCSQIGNGATSGGYLDLLEDSDNGTNYIRVQAADSIASNVTLKLPNADGATGGLLYYSGTSQLANLAAGTEGYILKMGALVPEWSNSLSVSSISSGGIILGDTTPDADGEIGYASNSYLWYANSEDWKITASTNLWTFDSNTGAAFAFTPAVTVTGLLTANAHLSVGNGATGPGAIQLKEDSDNGTDYSSITGSADAGSYPAFTFGGSQGSEDLTLTASSNKWTWSTSTGVTEVNFSAMDVVTTGTLKGKIPVVVNSATSSYSVTQAQIQASTFFITTNAATTTYTLPGAEAGGSACFMMGQGNAQVLRIDTDGSDYIVKSTGARTSAAGDYYGCASSAACMVCVVAFDTTDWYVTSERGTWTEE